MSIVNTSDYIDEDMKSEITELLDEFNLKTGNGLYAIAIWKDNKCYYEYYRDISSEAVEVNQSGGAMGNGVWTISYEITDLQKNYDSLLTDKIIYPSMPYQLNEFSAYLFVLS